MTKKEAIGKLKASDHAFLMPDKANKIAGAFGCDAPIEEYEDTRSQHKGLYIPSVEEGDKVKGVDAMVLAYSICHQLDIDYDNKLGRGSQLWACIEALENKS